MSEPDGLVQAVTDVMTDVGYIQGTGRNDQQHYRYTSDEDLLRKLQPAMAAHGLTMAPTETTLIETSEVATRAGGSMTRRIVQVTYLLRHTSGGQQVVMALGEGMDSGDKATYKALTGAYKYALRQAFAIPTGDDAEKPGVKTDAGQPEGRTAHRPAGPPARPETFALNHLLRAEPGRSATDSDAALPKGQLSTQADRDTPVPVSARKAAGLEPQDCPTLADCEAHVLSAFSQIHATNAAGRAFKDSAAKVLLDLEVAEADAATGGAA